MSAAMASTPRPLAIHDPELDPALQVNIHLDARMEPWTEVVPPVRGELREWAERPLEVDAERLLE